MGGPKKSRVVRHTVLRDSTEHRATAADAARRAGHVLGLFETAHPNDQRPRQAIEAIAAWAAGRRELGMAEVRTLSLAAHAAARASSGEAAKFAARAAGHAVATWHVPRHAEGAKHYTDKALAAAGRTRT